MDNLENIKSTKEFNNPDSESNITKEEINDTIKTYEEETTICIISEILEDINLYGHYGENEGSKVCDKHTGLTNEENTLNKIEKLLNNIAKLYHLEINQGAILNIAIPLLKFIIDNKILLMFSDEKWKIVGHSIGSKFTLAQVNIRRKTEGLEIVMTKVGRKSAETSVLAVLNGDYLKGKSYDPRLRRTVDYSIKFTKDGLLDTKKYQYGLFVSKNWPTSEEPLVSSKTKYESDKYQIYETITQNGKVLAPMWRVQEYVNPMNRIIDEVPGLIDIEHVDYLGAKRHKVPDFNNDSIKSVFREIWESADRARYVSSQRTRKRTNENNN